MKLNRLRTLAPPFGGGGPTPGPRILAVVDPFRAELIDDQVDDAAWDPNRAELIE